MENTEDMHIRVPMSMKEDIEKLAEHDLRSISQEVVYLLELSLKSKKEA